MAGVKRFQDLVAWQRAMALAKAVYLLTRQLPDAERFGLVQQIRRAAVSIPSNIAEGFGRQSTTDMVRFLRVARGSLFELDTQLRLSTELDMLSPDQVPRSLIDETDRVLQGLINSLSPTMEPRSA